MNKIIFAIAFVIFLAASLLLSDYFGLLGVNTRVEMDYAEITLEARNSDTGAPVFDVHVNCWKKGQSNICTERKAHRRDQISVFIPLNKTVKESWLFTQSEEVAFPKDTVFHLMLIHHDYTNPIETLDMKEIYEKRGKVMQIQMKPIVWKSSNTSNS